LSQCQAVSCVARLEVQSMKVAAPSGRHTPRLCLAPLTTGAMRCMLEAIRMVKASALGFQPAWHPGPVPAGSFEYAHVLSHMSEMGEVGIRAL
jgi:hypothetical protein